MDIWKHLLIDGEYPDRQRILSGLEPEHLSARPPGATRSIYEELWHITNWQDIVLSRDRDRREAWIRSDRYPPSHSPQDEREFRELVNRFLKGLRAAIELAQSDNELGREIQEGVTLRDELLSLATHNAYHLGKIVALRQTIGCWNGTTGTL